MGPRNGGLWWTGSKNTHTSDPGCPANDLCPFIGGGASGDGNPDWVGKTSSTLPGARPCRV